jgi:hypothetical protein
MHHSSPKYCKSACNRKINYLYSCGNSNSYGAIAVVPNFLLTEECNEIINLCERAGLYSRDDSSAYEQATFDIEVDKCQDLQQLLRVKEFISAIQPYILSVFGTYITAFDDMFVVKYDAECQRELVRHYDGGHVSFMLTLSPAAAYTGGGTHFDVLDSRPKTDTIDAEKHSEISQYERDERNLHCQVSGEGVVKASQGSLLLFNAAFYHTGMPILTGTRCLLVGFCYVDPHAGSRRGNVSLSFEYIE